MIKKLLLFLIFVFISNLCFCDKVIEKEFEKQLEKHSVLLMRVKKSLMRKIKHDFPEDYYTQAIELEKQMYGWKEMMKHEMEVRSAMREMELRENND